MSENDTLIKGVFVMMVETEDHTVCGWCQGRRQFLDICTHFECHPMKGTPLEPIKENGKYTRFEQRFKRCKACLNAEQELVDTVEYAIDAHEKLKILKENKNG